MKTGYSIIIALFILFLIFSCKEDKSSQPCDGNGIITFNNKIDSAVLVQVVEAHNTFTLNQNYIRSITVKGNQTYSLVLEGRNYYKDTTLSIHDCETINYIILR